MNRKKNRPLTPIEKYVPEENKRRKMPKKIFQDMLSLLTEIKKTYNEAFSCEGSSWVTTSENESQAFEFEDDDVFMSKPSDSDNDCFSSPERKRHTSRNVGETWSLDPLSWSDDSSESRTKEILHSTAIDCNRKSPIYPISPYIEEFINFSAIYSNESELGDVSTISFTELFERRNGQNSSCASSLSHKSCKQDQMKNVLHSTEINAMDRSFPNPSSSPIKQLIDLSSIRPDEKGIQKEMSSINPDKISKNENLSSINQDMNAIIIDAGNRNDSKKTVVKHQKSSKGNYKKNVLHSTAINTLNESPTLPFSPLIGELSFPPKKLNEKNKHKELSARKPNKIVKSMECENQNDFEKMVTSPKSSKRNRKKNVLHSTAINTLNELPTLRFSPLIGELSFPPKKLNEKSKHKELSARKPNKIGKGMECENQNDFEKMVTSPKKIENLTDKRFKKMCTPKRRKKSSKKQTKSRPVKKDVDDEEILRYKEYLKGLPIDDLSLKKWFKK